MPFPLYTQHDAMDCGPTCLRMIAAHYGRRYSLEGLREKSHLTREGVSMLGISEAAEKIGFRTIGAKLTLEQLLEAPLPCILHWNQNHFVVLYKTGKSHNHSQFHIADPAGTKFAMNVEEFARCWISSKQNGKEVGMALLLEPTPEFYVSEDEKTNRKGFGFLLSYLKPYKNLIFQLFLGLLFGSLLQLIFPFLTQSVVDIGINGRNIGFIYLILIAQMMLTLSSSSVEFIRGWILLHLGTRINIALISDFLIKLMKLPMGYFDTKMTGDILQRIGDHSRIQNFLTNATLGSLFSMFNILIFGIILCLYNLKIFAVFFVGSIFYFCWVWIFMKKRAELDHKNFAQQSANQSNVIQLVTGMQEIKLAGCEQQKRWEWERIQARLFKLRIKGLALGQYQDSGAILINQTKNILITVLVAKLVIDGQMTLGMMLSVQYIIGQLNGPVDQLISFFRSMQDAHLSLERLGEIHDKEDEEPLDENRIREFPAGKGLHFDNVSFSYDKTSISEPVIKNINLSIPANRQTAIVGTSGSGKTTLVKLLLGFYPPDKGAIRLGNNRIDAYSFREWRKRCGIVMQDGFIFSDTIARNIAPGVENIDKEKLRHAVEIANIRDFIESLPLAYNTKIGSEGHGLSQGQKQRILIARAVYKKPEFVFFDEATNALDAKNERTIMDNLFTFFQGKTVVVVAHRLSTVRNADQIVVLEKGEIVETGTHEELTKKQGAYYNLVKNQLEL
ncbi:MAG: peptidase domain-containing ABC transporter [Dysgonamonadaceae bacterium]|jgi:ATP-binding cassette subfamily B protein|nr:peptidase domain-containing ABC transporter [Dysgonamonadaceae bacterium]